VVPWAQLCALTEPVYPKGGSGEGGRPPVPLERMLRIYLLQLWFNLSDPAVEEALYDSAAMRSFARIDLDRERAPDETTVCKFRHLLKKHKLGEVLFKAVNRHLHEQGIKVSRGTIVDASIISALLTGIGRAKPRIVMRLISSHSMSRISVFDSAHANGQHLRTM